jgi:transcriptional regulator with XRE-family HTH domain
MGDGRVELVSDQLRAAIAAAPVSRYRIARDTGVHESALSRFVRGERLLDLSSVDKLAAYLGLGLVPLATPGARDAAGKNPVGGGGRPGRERGGGKASREQRR